MTLLYLTLVALSYLSFAVAEPFHIPLVRRREPPSIRGYVNAANTLGNQYPHSPPSKRQDIPVINQYHDTNYLGVVQIGTPPQSFKVLLTTGATDLWVTGLGCGNCTRGTPGFDNTTSSTFQAGGDPTHPTRVAIPYSYGSVAGSVIRDTVRMGGFRVQNQTWLLVDQVPTQLLDGSCSGSIGLAFDNIGWTGATPFWQTLADSGQLTTPEMSFWFTRLIDNTNAQEEEFGGVFTLGGRNQTLYAGDVEFLPLVTNAGRRTYWLLDLSEITVNKKDIALLPGNVAAIVTGTTLIGGPRATISAIYAQIPNSQPLSGEFAGYYGFPCDTTVEVTMAFGGKSWPIDSRDMSFGRVSTGSDLCLGGFFEFIPYSNNTGNPNWVVGVAFLKNVYSIFRYQPPGIGFAALSDTRAVASTGVPAGGGGNGNNTDGGANDNNNNTNNDNANTGATALPQVSSVVLLATAASLFAHLF